MHRIYRVNYNHNQTPGFVKYVIIPMACLALIAVTTGIYSFIGANRIMRVPPLSLDSFANNILPSYSNASFTSLDGNTGLSGWYFPAKSNPVSTIIMIHGYGSNRLRYGVDTVEIYDYLVKSGFNVLSFDLRHAGKSDGTVSAFGYSEWQDVLGAISYVKRVSTTTDVILYGFGSGVSAALIAMDNLPEKNDDFDDYPYNIQLLGFSREYIRGLILECPMNSADDYIKSVCRDELWLGTAVGQYVVPYAVRLSSGSEKKVNLTSIITRSQVPVHLIYGNYSDDILSNSASFLIDERVRMFPDHTTVYNYGDGESVDAFSEEFDYINEYTESLGSFLNRFILIGQ